MTADGTASHWSFTANYDGKTRTTTTKGTDVKGQPVDVVSFYEKQ